jgi:hypothetical protein
MGPTTDTREVEILINAQKANASIKEMGAGVALLTNQLTKMAADDPRRAALKRDFDVLTERVGAARKEMRTYVMTEEEMRLATAKLNEENQKVILNGQKLNSSFKDMRASASLLEQQLESMNGDAPERKKLLADYHALQDRIEGISHEMKGASKESGFFKQALGNAVAFAAGGGIEAIGEKLLDVGKDIAESTAKFETYETVMTNALGSKSKAQQAMKDIQTMAAKTPFSIDELTGSFIKFVNRGLNPSMAEMTKMADLAASQGKSFDQLTEAVLDAGGGEFERLKEFGVKASKSGDQVSLSFKGVNQVVKNTPEAINGAIMAFGNMQGVAGATAAISKTLDGTWSNLGDTAGQIEVVVGKGLRPAFMWLLTMFGSLLNWVGRFIEGAAPLKTLFLEVMEVFADLYHDIGEVLESLGLFSEKTDTVKMALDALKFVLTVLLLPVKAIAMAARGVVDLFIDWYNKSELLRGVLGGLGAVVVGLFTMIKDNALKILGGVSDILIGIFTLDKDKIVAGFKSAMSATAQVMLEGGNQAAANFKKGYEANKDNHITHKVRVKTETEGEAEASPAGEKLTSDTSAGDAADAKKAEAAAKKAKAERDRRDREHLADLKKWVKDQGDILEGSSEMERARQEAANTDELKRREAQRHKIIQDAEKKYRDLLLLDGDHTLQMQQVVEDRDLKLRELQAKWNEEDKKQKEQDLQDKLAAIETDNKDAITALEETHTLGLVSEQEYQDQLYFLQKQGLEKRLALLEAAGKGETKEAASIRAAIGKVEGDYTKKKKTQEEDLAKFNMNMASQGAHLLVEGLQQVEDMLDKKSAAYEAFKAARKTAEMAELGINLAAEIQAIWKAASENPLNGITAGAAGTAQGVLLTGLAVARATAAGAKIMGFEKGGPTGGGMLADTGMWNLLGDATGMSVSSGGKLVDEKGLEVAGIVHKNEYVIPEWMRKDPQVLQVENWLEARRQRGSFYDGGPTTAGDRRAPAATGEVASEQAGVGLLAQLVPVLASLDQRLSKVEDWPTQFEVVLDLLGLDREQEKIKKVKAKSEIKPK